MGDYKKAGTKKIEGKKTPVVVYKKTGSPKLYVMRKGRMMSYVNYKKMCAKKLMAKKVTKVRKVRKVRKGGEGCGYHMQGGEELEPMENEPPANMPPDMPPSDMPPSVMVESMKETDDELLGGAKKPLKSKKSKKPKKPLKTKKLKGGESEELLGGAKKLKKSKKSKKPKK